MDAQDRRSVLQRILDYAHRRPATLMLLGLLLIQSCLSLTLLMTFQWEIAVLRVQIKNLQEEVDQLRNTGKGDAAEKQP